MKNELLKHAANVAVAYMILATTDDGGTGKENGNIDVDASVGENITGLNGTDTVSSKSETAEGSGNDTDPSSNDGGTVEKDGKNVTDVKAVGTVSGNDESSEESGNDTDPASDNNGKDDEHVADQKAIDIASDNNDNGTADEDGKDVADVKVICTVCGNDESAEESGNDTDPASDNNGIRTSMLQMRRLQTQHPITMAIELPTRMEWMSQM